MQIILFFIITGFTLSLLYVFIRSTRSIPLAAGFLFIGILHGLIFKPLLFLTVGSSSIVGIYILSPISLSQFWLGGILVATSMLVVVLIIIGLECMFGYKTNRTAFRYYKQPVSVYFDTVFCFIFSVFGLVALIYFLDSHPGLLELRGKNSMSSTNLREYSSSGITRLFINLNYVVVFLMMHNIAVGAKVGSSKLILVVSAFIFIVYAVLSGSRATILFSFLSWAVFAYISGLRMSVKFVIFSSMFSISLVLIVSVKRIFFAGNSTLDNIISVLANFAGKNFIDITKTIAIYESETKLRAGSTFLDAILILVPRSIFPEKTTVNIDTLIAAEVFDIHSFGSGAIPPGMIGEMIFNFGWISVPIGLIFTGVIIWIVDFLRYGGRSCYLIFYTMSLYGVGVAILGSSFQSTFISLVMTGLPLLFVYQISLRHSRAKKS